MPRVKMEGNMMELQKPTTSMANMARWPWVRSEMTTRMKAPMAATVRTGAGADALQDGGADESADHGAAPVDHEEVAGDGFGGGLRSGEGPCS